MAAQLIWIVLIYASAAFGVHALHAWARRKPSSERGGWTHIVVITRNHESVVEGVVRSLALHACLTGKAIRVTLMDDGSTDQTQCIAALTGRNACGLDFRFGTHAGAEPSGAPGNGYIMDLRQYGTDAPQHCMRFPGQKNG